MFRQRIYDAGLVLKTAGTVVTSGMATKWDGVAGARTANVVTIDVGTGWTQGAFVVQLARTTLRNGAVVGTGASGQSFMIELRGGTTKAFIREVPLAAIRVAMSSEMMTRWKMTTGNPATLASTSHEYILPFTNEYDGTIYPYLRCYHTIMGTWATGINYTAWISKL
jgi:hypothetical protein